jgi:hypothetical protein
MSIAILNFIVSDDAGLMTGAVVNWGATAGAMPVPDKPLSL